MRDPDPPLPHPQTRLLSKVPRQPGSGTGVLHTAPGSAHPAATLRVRSSHTSHTRGHTSPPPTPRLLVGASGTYKMTQDCSSAGSPESSPRQGRRGQSSGSKARRAANCTAAPRARRSPCAAHQGLPRAQPFGAGSAPLRARKSLLRLRKGVTGRRKTGVAPGSVPSTQRKMTQWFRPLPCSLDDRCHSCHTDASAEV